MARYYLVDLNFILVWTSVVLVFCLPGAALFHMGWSYQTQGGGLLEKIHPSTMILFFGFFLHCLQKKTTIISSVAIVNWVFRYFISIIFLLVYVGLVLKKPTAVFIDTWLALGAYLILWTTLRYEQIIVLRNTVTVLVFVNMALGVLEFFGGFRLVPLVLVDVEDFGGVLDISEWSESRSSALLNHPLTASLISAVYFFITLSLVIFDKPTKIRFLLIVLSFAAMVVFGGRASIGITLCFSVLLLLWVVLNKQTFSKVSDSGFRVSLWMIFIIPLLFIVVWVFGMLDPLLARIQDDNGSAESRLVVLDILLDTSIVEYLFGDIYGRLIDRILSHGALYGLEISWLNIALNYGFLGLAIIFIPLFGLLRSFSDRPHFFNPWLIFGLFFIISSTAVYFSSKTLVVTQLIVLVSVFVFKYDRSITLDNPVRN